MTRRCQWDVLPAKCISRFHVEDLASLSVCIFQSQTKQYHPRCKILSFSLEDPCRRNDVDACAARVIVGDLRRRALPRADPGRPIHSRHDGARSEERPPRGHHRLLRHAEPRVRRTGHRPRRRVPPAVAREVALRLRRHARHVPERCRRAVAAAATGAGAVGRVGRRGVCGDAR